MTKQELLDAIRANWFSSDEDLVDFIFENVPEIKEPPILPIVKCKECKYAHNGITATGCIYLGCEHKPQPVTPDYYCARGERK